MSSKGADKGLRALLFYGCMYKRSKNIRNELARLLEDCSRERNETTGR